MKQEIPTLLSVKNLSVAFRENHVIKHISFDIHKEEVLAIVGPNGAGKSVLLKTLLGIIEPTAGSIEWFPGIRIGYLPQRFHVDMYLPMTVGEFLDLKPRKILTNEAVLRLLKLEKSWLKKRLAHLSSGQLQRILLAWALLDDPQILLFDEPTENVDVAGQESIYTLLHHLQDTTGLSLILVSHDLQVVYKYANNVLCLNGKQVCYGEPKEALDHKTLSELFGDHTVFHHHHL
ncbi:MAG: zinc transport system ATP-binding protein [Parcubacteria group bacterium LiPW_41]|nr:MAG: zinc transport system ATP-binding protein [Parcubacteria group bacterium LiPW_41]